MCDGQPAATLSSVVAADNRRFYLDDADDEELPFDLDALFPHRKSNSTSEFSKWFCRINLQCGFLGVGKHNSIFDGKFMALPGGFHATMKTHNCRGMMFGNIVHNFFGAWRDTHAKVNWILFPKDPRQLENELPQYILSHYRSAFMYL